MSEKITKIEDTKKKVAPKKLTLAELRKQDKKLNEQGKFFVTINEAEFEILYDMKFRKSKRIKVLEDIISLVEEGNNRLEILELASAYISLMIVKHFTSIEVPEDIDEALEILNQLIDLEIFEAIINALPEEEMVSMLELVSESVENMTENLEELKNEANKVEIDNKDLGLLLTGVAQEDSEEEEVSNG